MIPVDAVYTWVDGADARHRAKRAQYRPAPDRPAPDRPKTDRPGPADPAATPERWRDNGELRYSLRSLHRYAPWIRRIFIVTDDQVPAWLDTAHPQIEIVDHTAIFPDRRLLPTFNSCVIEAFLHRIPGLSSHYLYFNDDMFLGRPVSPRDFLTPAGGQLLYVEPRPLPTVGQWASGWRDPHGLLLAYTRLLLHAAFGRDASVLDLPHAPQLYVKSEVEAVVDQFADALAFGLTERFRGWRMPLLSLLYVNRLLSSPAGGHVGRVLADDEYRFIMLRDDGDGARPLFDRSDPPWKFFCVNDDRRDPAARPLLAVALDIYLRRRFPHPSPFERRRDSR